MDDDHRQDIVTPASFSTKSPIALNCEIDDLSEVWQEIP